MFDPTYPPENAEIESAPLRSQFISLKTLIDAVSGVTSAVVDVVTTLPPGSAAVVGVSVVGTQLHLSFQIPCGDNGELGQTGPEGPMGMQGPPFANAVVDGVTTLPAGDQATVSVSFDGANVRFSFGIPQGQSGPPGEVTQAALNTAIAGTSTNSNLVGTLGMAVSDPPTQAEMQTLANKVDELILALRR